MTATIRVNGKDEEIPAGGLAALLAAHGVRQTRGCAVAINGAVVPASAWATQVVAPGDEVEILRIVGGG